MAESGVRQEDRQPFDASLSQDQHAQKWADKLRTASVLLGLLGFIAMVIVVLQVVGQEWRTLTGPAPPTWGEVVHALKPRSMWLLIAGFVVAALGGVGSARAEALSGLTPSGAAKQESVEHKAAVSETQSEAGQGEAAAAKSPNSSFVRDYLIALCVLIAFSTFMLAVDGKSVTETDLTNLFSILAFLLLIGMTGYAYRKEIVAWIRHQPLEAAGEEGDDHDALPSADAQEKKGAGLPRRAIVRAVKTCIVLYLASSLMEFAFGLAEPANWHKLIEVNRQVVAGANAIQPLHFIPTFYLRLRQDLSGTTPQEPGLPPPGAPDVASSLVKPPALGSSWSGQWQTSGGLGGSNGLGTGPNATPLYNVPPTVSLAPPAQPRMGLIAATVDATVYMAKSAWDRGGLSAVVTAIVLVLAAGALFHSGFSRENLFSILFKLLLLPFVASLFALILTVPMVIAAILTGKIIVAAQTNALIGVGSGAASLYAEHNVEEAALKRFVGEEGKRLA